MSMTFPNRTIEICIIEGPEEKNIGWTEMEKTMHDNGRMDFWNVQLLSSTNKHITKRDSGE